MNIILTQRQKEEIEETISDQLIGTDDPEDCRRSLFFAIQHLEEIEKGQTTLSDKLFDLRMRYCRFI